MSGSDLAPPGSSTYSSGTMYVGDGTWDKSHNTFLLPNLMGLNFDTMQYNGMGNRFRDLTGYSSLIIAHGVMATIVFLGFVPAGVLVMRYYSQWTPYWAHKYHAWLYVLSLLLSTAVFMTGWFAVGPERSLTNPHHGIGVALYVMLIFQVFWGWFSHRLERGRENYRLPLKFMIHNWLGWAVVLLGLAQIPLGLTLYGSPKSLFILYAVGAFFWLALFFILSYLYDDSGGFGSDYDSRGSYMAGPSVVEDHHHSGIGRTAAAAAAGAGLASLFRRRSRGRPDAPTSAAVEEPPWRESHTSFVDEKHSDEPRHSGWGKRLLEVGAIAGAAGLAKRIFDRRRDRDSDSESGHYRPAHARSDSMTEDTVSRVEEGRATGPLQNQPPRRRVSRESVDDSYFTASDEGRGHGVRDAILGAGAFAAFRNLFKRRKDKEEDRIEELRRQDIEEERIARANSKRKYTGDGFFPRRNRPTDGSMVSTDLSTDITPRPPRGPGAPLPGSTLSGEPMVSGGVNQPPPVDVPPIPSSHRRGSEAASGHALEAAAAGAIAGATVGTAAERHRRRRSSSSRRRQDDVASPPVSVKVKMHNDGRHVTLRRLTEEEAAASHGSRQGSKERKGSRQRHGSVSSQSGTEGTASDRWRRVGGTERKQAEQTQREQEATTASGVSTALPPPVEPQAAPSNVSVPPPPPPPAPPSLPYGAGSVTSPGTWTGTDASGDYASNRRRRRAERAQARQARQQQHGVEFT